MKLSKLLLISISIFLIFSCNNKERYGGRMTIDADTGVVTPLNQECCYYLAYKSLTNQNAPEAQAFLEQLLTFPQPVEKKIILEEGVKTLWALSYLQEKNYEKAIVFIRQLNSVDIISTNQMEYQDKDNYVQLRRVRSASIQLRKSLPALEEYLALKQKNALNPTIYASLKHNWYVGLVYHKYSSMREITYSFPSLN